METCACFDPGYILQLLIGTQQARALNTWLNNELKQIKPGINHGFLSQNDLIWMKSGNGILFPKDEKEGLKNISGCMEDLLISLDGIRGLKKSLESFIRILASGARFIRLICPQTDLPVDKTRTHLMVRLLRSILMSIQSEQILIVHPLVDGMDATVFWGNTQNEAHLVENQGLQEVIFESLAVGNADLLIKKANGIKLPGLNTSYFNYCSFNNLPPDKKTPAALASLFMFSGLPAVDGLDETSLPLTVFSLIKARQESAAFSPVSAMANLNLHPAVFSVIKIAPDIREMVVCLVNLSPNPLDFTMETEKSGFVSGVWTDLVKNSKVEVKPVWQVELGGYDILWLSHSI